MSKTARRLEYCCPYIDDGGVVSRFNCHRCKGDYYGSDSDATQFKFCPLCGVVIDHSEFLPKNAEKQRRKNLRRSAKSPERDSRQYVIHIQKSDGTDIYDHYNKRPHGLTWKWYGCGFINGGLSFRTVSEIGCAAVLESFREHCNRFSEGYRGYMEAELAMPKGQYKLTLMRDGVPSISRLVDSAQP